MSSSNRAERGVPVSSSMTATRFFNLSVLFHFGREENSQNAEKLHRLDLRCIQCIEFSNHSDFLRSINTHPQFILYGRDHSTLDYDGIISTNLIIRVFFFVSGISGFYLLAGFVSHRAKRLKQGVSSSYDTKLWSWTHLLSFSIARMRLSLKRAIEQVIIYKDFFAKSFILCS